MQDIIFYDVRKVPFSIHGLWEAQKGGEFLRIPEEIAKQCNKHIAEGLYRNTAGGRVRFATDSDTLVVRATRTPEEINVRIAPYLEFGFDLYMKTPMEQEVYWVISYSPCSTSQQPRICSTVPRMWKN